MVFNSVQFSFVKSKRTINGHLHHSKVVKYDLTLNNNNNNTQICTVL